MNNVLHHWWIFESPAGPLFTQRKGKVTYNKISWSLKPRDSCINFSNRSRIRQTSRQQRSRGCRDACQIAQRHDPNNFRYCGFETSRDLAVIHFTLNEEFLVSTSHPIKPRLRTTLRFAHIKKYVHIRKLNLLSLNVCSYEGMCFTMTNMTWNMKHMVKCRAKWRVRFKNNTALCFLTRLLYHRHSVSRKAFITRMLILSR